MVKISKAAIIRANETPLISIKERPESTIEADTKIQVRSVTGKAFNLSLFKLQLTARLKKNALPKASTDSPKVNAYSPSVAPALTFITNPVENTESPAISIEIYVSLLTLKNINAKVPSVHITTALTYLIAFSGEQNTIYPRAEPIVANKKFFLPDTAINANANGQQPPTTLEKQRRKATSPHSTRLPYITIFFKSFLGILILSLTVIFTHPKCIIVKANCELCKNKTAKKKTLSNTKF